MKTLLILIAKIIVWVMIFIPVVLIPVILAGFGNSPVPQQPCPTKIEVTYFKGGKPVDSSFFNKGFKLGGLLICGHKDADSITAKIK